MGNPKYLSRWEVKAIEVTHVIRSRLPRVTAGPAKARDLAMLTFMPDTEQKSLRIPWISLICDIFALANNKTSSAKKKMGYGRPMRGNPYRKPSVLINLLLTVNAQPLNTQNKQIRRKRVSLTQATSSRKRGELIPIPKKGKGGGGHTKHYQPYGGRRKP